MRKRKREETTKSACVPFFSFHFAWNTLRRRDGLHQQSAGRGAPLPAQHWEARRGRTTGELLPSLAPPSHPFWSAAYCLPIIQVPHFPNHIITPMYLTWLAFPYLTLWNSQTYVPPPRSLFSTLSRSSFPLTFHSHGLLLIFLNHLFRYLLSRRAAAALHHQAVQPADQIRAPAGNGNWQDGECPAQDQRGSWRGGQDAGNQVEGNGGEGGPFDRIYAYSHT